MGECGCCSECGEEIKNCPKCKKPTDKCVCDKRAKRTRQSVSKKKK